MRRLIASLLALCAISACSYSRHVQRRSSLMSYLDRAEAVHGRFGGEVQAVYPPDAETRLLQIVRKAFMGRDWVSDVMIIPSSYLTPRGGYENLDQIARLMNVDVIALTSVDQLQVSNPRRASFLYVSVIGAYVLPLDRNETRTMIDAAVFHVPSRTLLLHAPGISSITGSSTAMDVQAKLDERSLKGFEFAMQDLAKNLNREVDAFKASVASGERKDVDIVTAQGKSVRGGGAFAWWDVVIAIAALWTCHLMHWSWQHALFNAIAALPPMFVMRRRLWELTRFALLAAPLIALAVRVGFDGQYRGASGLVVAMWVYAAVMTRAGPMLMVIAAKLAAEALGLVPAHEGFVTVALAHYAGATVGILGVILSRRRLGEGSQPVGRDPSASLRSASG